MRIDRLRENIRYYSERRKWRNDNESNESGNGQCSLSKVTSNEGKSMANTDGQPVESVIFNDQ